MRVVASGQIVVALVAFVLVASGAASARSQADWRYISVVFTGSGGGTLTFAPGRVGRSAKFTVRSWKVVWRIEPNGGYGRVTSYSIAGRSSFIGSNPKDDCSGAIAPTKNNVPQLLPTGTKGRYTLLGASVPMIGFFAEVPSCANTLGASLNSAILYEPGAAAAAEVKHVIGVAEFPLDFANPGGITIKYPRTAGGVWVRKDGTGAKQTLRWRGKLVVTVVK